MNRAICQLTLVVLAATAAGCATSGHQRSAASGRNVFASLQAAVAEASEQARESVALMTLKGSGLGDERRMVLSSDGRLRASDNSGSKTMTGVIVTTNGYVIIAEAVDPGAVTRIEAWIGDDEYSASVVKSDRQLGLTVLKIDVDEPVKPLNLDNVEDPQIGDWCVGVQPSGEDFDYEQFVSVALCRGQAAGRYREFLLDNAGGISQGSPILGLSGNVIGIVGRPGRVLAMSDIRDDLIALLGEAAGVKSADEEARQKAWFGVVARPINKEYARKYDLSKSYLWVNYVIKDSPADAAGVKTGDLVTRVNGRDMHLTGQRAHSYFLNALHPKVNQPFTLTVLRDGDLVELEGTFTKQPEKKTVCAADLGVTVTSIEDGDLVERNLFTSEGVLVIDIQRGSAASVGSNMKNSLLNSGDIITAIGGTLTPDLDTFSTVLEKLRRERPEILLVTYLRGRTTGFAALNLKIGENGNEGGNQK